MHKAPRSSPLRRKHLCSNLAVFFPSSPPLVPGPLHTPPHAIDATRSAQYRKFSANPSRRALRRARLDGPADSEDGLLVAGEVAWAFRNAPQALRSQSKASTSTSTSTSRVQQSSSLFMESCLRSLATGQHCGSTGQRIHYFPGQHCGCRLCLRADLYKKIYETKLQDSLRRADTPRRTDQG